MMLGCDPGGSKYLNDEYVAETMLITIRTIMMMTTITITYGDYNDNDNGNLQVTQ